MFLHPLYFLYFSIQIWQLDKIQVITFGTYDYFRSDTEFFHQEAHNECLTMSLFMMVVTNDAQEPSSFVY